MSSLLPLNKNDEDIIQQELDWEYVCPSTSLSNGTRIHLEINKRFISTFIFLIWMCD